MATPDWLTLNDQIITPDRMVAPQVPPYLAPNAAGPQDPWDIKKLKADLAKQLAEQNAARKVQEPAMSEMPPPNPALQRFSPVGMSLSPEEQAQRADLMKKFKELVAKSESGIEQGQQTLQDARNLKTGIDFTPIAALADKWGGGGSQLSQAAQSIKGMTPEEKTQLLAKLETAQLDKQEKLANIVGARVDKLDSQKLAMQLAQEQNKNLRFMYSQDSSKLGKLNQDLRNDIKPFMEGATAVDSIEANLKPDAQGRIPLARLTQSLSQASRALGEKGVLTEGDIGRVQPKNWEITLGNWQNRLSTDPNATIDAKSVEPLLASLRAAREAAKMNAMKRLTTTRDTHISMGVDPVQAAYIANNLYRDNILGGKPVAPDAGVGAVAPGSKDAALQDAQDILKSLGR